MHIYFYSSVVFIINGFFVVSSLQPVTTPTHVKKNDNNNHLLSQQNINNPWNKELIKSKQDEVINSKEFHTLRHS